jgi:hypothetical protein
VGEVQSAGRRDAGGGRQLTMTRAATIRELEDWELNGATWRPLELTDRHTLIELRTCHGEAVDVVESHDPELIDFVRSHEAQQSD